MNAVVAIADAVGTEVPTPALITAIVSLAGVVAFLFKLYDRRLTAAAESSAKLESERAAERTAWAVERTELHAEMETLTERLRADYEEKFRELLGRYDEISSRERAANRAHEDLQRKEFGDAMEVVAEKAEKSSAAVVATLEKFYDRFVGPRR